VALLRGELREERPGGEAVITRMTVASHSQAAVEGRLPGDDALEGRGRRLGAVLQRMRVPARQDDQVTAGQPDGRVRVEVEHALPGKQQVERGSGAGLDAEAPGRHQLGVTEERAAHAECAHDPAQQIVAGRFGEELHLACVIFDARPFAALLEGRG
jgi:hypothetical protein